MSVIPSRASRDSSATFARPVRIALYNEFSLVAPHLARELSSTTPELLVETLPLDAPVVRPYDAILLDPTALPEERRWLQVRQLSRHPQVGMVVLYAGYLSQDWLEQGRLNGAHAHVLKTLTRPQVAAEIMRLVRQPMPPRTVTARVRAWPGAAEGLTLREADVLSLVASGRSNEETARLLGVSINTVKTYIRTAYRKAGVATRAQAVRWAIEHGLGEHQPPIVTR